MKITLNSINFYSTDPKICETTNLQLNYYYYFPRDENITLNSIKLGFFFAGYV
jgi:hypothetical protein